MLVSNVTAFTEAAFLLSSFPRTSLPIYKMLLLEENAVREAQSETRTITPFFSIISENTVVFLTRILHSALL